jgi:hypothetical protein
VERRRRHHHRRFTDLTALLFLCSSFSRTLVGWLIRADDGPAASSLGYLRFLLFVQQA